MKSKNQKGEITMTNIQEFVPIKFKEIEIGEIEIQDEDFNSYIIKGTLTVSDKWFDGYKGTILKRCAGMKGYRKVAEFMDQFPLMFSKFSKENRRKLYQGTVVRVQRDNKFSGRFLHHVWDKVEESLMW